MSNEVKTKEKIDMDPKYIIKLTVTLLLTCMVVAGLLGWVNSITKDKIAAITWEKTVAAMKEVIPADDFSDALEITDDMSAAASAQGGTLAAVYQAQSGGQPVGYAINVEASGSQGIISMMVGVDMDGAVTGVSIVTNAETSGIGSKVMGHEPLANGTGVLDQFCGGRHPVCGLQRGRHHRRYRVHQGRHHRRQYRSGCCRCDRLREEDIEL